MRAAPKFTPGPWSLDTWEGALVGAVEHKGVHESVWAAGEMLICTTGLEGTPESRENARLIAAAPELYEITRRVAEHFADTDAPLGIAARAALAKVQQS